MTKKWKEGTIGIPQEDGGYKAVHYWVRALKRKSKDGINGGKITNLILKVNEEIICNYNKGWELELDQNDKAALIAYSILLNEHN